MSEEKTQPEFDDVMNKQRETIYALRRQILEGRDLKTKILEMMAQMTGEDLAALEEMKKTYAERENELGAEQMRAIEKLVMLRVIDSAWIDQLHNMDTLREGIGLRGMGGRDPLIEYKIEGYGMFQEMMRGVREEIIDMIFKVQLVGQEEQIPQPKVPKMMVGRNDPCPCGSGKKYKKCCLPKEEKS